MTSENRDNSRKFQRVLFDADTRIEGASGNVSASLIDISLNGALIHIPEEWCGAIGDDLTISVQLDQEESIIRMQTRVAHIESDHIGLPCEHIDMDSITHLRRLVELNLGDAELLERELVAMG